MQSWKTRTMVLVTAVVAACGASGAPVRAGHWHDEGTPYPMKPHPAIHAPWEKKVGDKIYHQHHFYGHVGEGLPRDIVPGHKLGHPLFGWPQADEYDPYSVWVNETYHNYEFDDYFSHGFIIEEPGPTPEYQFDQWSWQCQLYNEKGKAVDARPAVRRAFKRWSGIRQDDACLELGLEFREAPLWGDGPELYVRFVDYLPGALARWTAGSMPETRVLAFARYHDKARTQKIRWYFGGPQDGMRKSPAEADLRTVAMHEVGHVVGLDHQSPIHDWDDVMCEGAGLRQLYDKHEWKNPANKGPAFRSFSHDDRLGARDLYSIPIPEPAGLLLLAAVLPLVRRRRAA